MRRTHSLPLLSCIVGLTFVLALTTSALSLDARPLSNPHPYYDLSREVTLTGIVSGVLAKPAKGMILGSHLLLQTPSGLVDASLGRFATSGAKPFVVSPGQQVELTGITKNLNHRDVFIVRLATANGETFTIRNERGLAVRPRTRPRNAHKGESR